MIRLEYRIKGGINSMMIDDVDEEDLRFFIHLLEKTNIEVVGVMRGVS